MDKPWSFFVYTVDSISDWDNITGYTDITGFTKIATYESQIVAYLDSARRSVGFRPSFVTDVNYYPLVAFFDGMKIYDYRDDSGVWRLKGERAK